MQIFDFKAMLGITGTAITSLFTWFQDTLELTTQVPLTDWIPLIPAIPTAIYMGFKAWEKYRQINGKDDE